MLALEHRVEGHDAGDVGRAQIHQISNLRIDVVGDVADLVLRIVQQHDERRARDGIARDRPRRRCVVEGFRQHRVRSPVDVPHDRIDRREDRDEVGEQVARARSAGRSASS